MRCKLTSQRQELPEKCAQEVLCKAMDEFEDVIAAQTEAMGAAGLQLGNRLDTADMKIGEIETIGKKLTDVLDSQAAKVGDLGADLEAKGAALTEQVIAQAAAIEDKMGGVDAKMGALGDANKKLTAELAAQDEKLTGIQEEGAKVLDSLPGQAKTITAALQATGIKLIKAAPLTDAKVAEIAEAQATIADKIEKDGKKLEAVAAANEALQTSLGEAMEEVAGLEDAAEGATAKAGDLEEGILAHEQGEAEIKAGLAEQEGAIGDVAEQTAALGEKVAASEGVVNALEGGMQKKKEKCAKIAETVAEIAAGAAKAEAATKDQERKLDAVQEKMDAPPPPPA